MLTRRPDRVRLALLTLFVGLSWLGLAIAPASAAPGGNAWAAKACQKGGYVDWVREDGTAFATTGECVSYAARHGQLYTRQPAPPATLTLTVWREGPNLLRFTLTGTGLEPRSRVYLTITLADGLQSTFDRPVNMDGVIDPSFNDTYSCTRLPSFSAQAIRLDGTIIRAEVLNPCTTLP
jgi:hypothetical protein